MACSVGDCGRTVRARGLCSTHYQRLQKHGDVSVNLNPVRPQGLTLAEAFERFEKKPTDSGCILWCASISSRGYGQMHWRGRPVLAHRTAYELACGQIPEGKQVDHVCRQRTCVNAAHLRLVNNKQNQENRGGAQANSRSGFRGVHWYARERKWAAVVHHNGRNHHGGLFDDPVAADAAATALRLELFTHNETDRLVLA